eukprot:88319-Pyramimonas_sp.AAC.1
MGTFVWRRPAHVGTPFTYFLPPVELHRGPQYVRSHGVAPLMMAHPAHVSCPPKERHRGPP